VNESTHWKIIEEGLRGISLPPLIPTALGPEDAPAEALARWAMMMYAYSSIAHVRKILAGLVVLADAGNTPAADVICRHVFEWAASACYVEQKIGQYFKEQKWKPASDLLCQISGGNLWLRNHGHKYDALPMQLEAPNPIRIGKLVEVYEKYQADQLGEGDAKDAYGFLSEHSHPNGACLRQYQEIEGWRMKFVDPPPSDPRGINRPSLEWLVFIHGILALAKEDVVRLQVVDILTKTVMPGQAIPLP
jgi:hypothetical protein